MQGWLIGKRCCRVRGRLRFNDLVVSLYEASRLRVPIFVDHSVNPRLAFGAVIAVNSHAAPYLGPYPPACPDLNSGWGFHHVRFSFPEFRAPRARAPLIKSCAGNDRGPQTRDVDRSHFAPNTSIMKARSNQTLVHDLHELIAALDRRVPRLEREGERDIAVDAKALKLAALRRIAELERSLSAPGIRTVAQET